MNSHVLSTPSFEPAFIMTSHHHTKSYSPTDLEISSLNLCHLLSNCFTFRCENFNFKIKFWAPKPQTWKTS